MSAPAGKQDNFGPNCQVSLAGALVLPLPSFQRPHRNHRAPNASSTRDWPSPANPGFGASGMSGAAPMSPEHPVAEPNPPHLDIS
jgi:hypothetical protein